MVVEAGLFGCGHAALEIGDVEQAPLIIGLATTLIQGL